jgi:SP family facilitated glucose transporter-like MFS transporter 8
MLFLEPACLEAGIYTTENCTPTFRGVIGGVIQLAFFGAVFVEYSIASYFTHSNTAIINAVISGIMLITLYFTTETPYFLVMKGKHEEAEKNLTWLQSDGDLNKIAEEMKRIRHGVQEEKHKKTSLARLLTSGANFKAINIVVGIYVLCAATGGFTFISYASLIFTRSDSVSVEQYSILFSVFQFAAVALSPFIVEKLNRRTLLIGSMFGITCCNACSCVLLYLRHHNYSVFAYPWMIFASVALYGGFSSLMAPASYAIKGELLPLSVRAIGSSMAVIAQSITSFLIAKMFIPVEQNFGMESNFLFYSVMGVVTTVLIYVILPETRGKSLHDIQKSMKGGDVPSCAEDKFGQSSVKLIQDA